MSKAHRPRRERERGSAMIVTMIVLFMLMLLAVTVTSISTTRSASALDAQLRVPAEAIAEIGIGVKLDQIEGSGGADLDPVTVDTAQGSVTVTATPVGDSIVRLDAVAHTTARGVTSRIEAHVVSSFHPAFFKAIYVGNRHGIASDLTLGPAGAAANPDPSETLQANWESLWENDADYVDGDIWVNGTVQLKMDTKVWGDVDTTNTLSGAVVTGNVSEGVAPIPPPDLAAMGYETRPETVVIDDPNAIPADLSEVFYKGRDTNDIHYSGAQGLQDNGRIFHLGRVTSADGPKTVGFDTSHNGKIYYVKGNLWIHSVSDKALPLPDDKNIQLTIVVEGNLYISDDLNYGENTTTGELTDSGILFIAKGDDANPESFVDANKNYRYDVGETIINDGGEVGVYEGPAEGQGNVYFGDARYGTGGVTHGFMYAQNNAYLTVPPNEDSVDQDWEKIYGVYGFLSAGGIFDLGARTVSSKYRNYKVTYDSRIQDGTLTLPGIPSGNGGDFAGLRVISWRTLPAGK